MDQPAGCGGGAGRFGAGGPGPGAPGHQCGPGGALPHCWGGGGGRHWRYPHQLPWRETEDAPTGRLLGRPAGPYIRGL